MLEPGVPNALYSTEVTLFAAAAIVLAVLVNPRESLQTAVPPPELGSEL